MKDAHKSKETSAARRALPRRKTAIAPVIALCVVAITVLAFFPALKNDFVRWDDDENIIRNHHFRGLGLENLKWMFTTLHMWHYQPLSWMTLGADWMIWGLEPFGFHLTNVLIHAAGAAFLYLLAIELLSAASGGRSGAALHASAVFAALVYAVHPLRAEAVAWVTERREVLNGFFAILCVLLYVGAAKPTISARLRRRRYIAAVVFCACSLLSKAMTITLPGVLIVLDVYPLRRLHLHSRQAFRNTVGRCLLEKAPFLALAAGAVVIALHAQRAALVSLEQYGVARRLVVAAYGAVFYVRKTLLPTALLPLYEWDPELDPFQMKYVACACVVASITVSCFALRKRYPAGLAAWLVYLGTLAPVSGISQNGPQLVADRFSYLTCIPFALLAGGAVLALLRPREKRRTGALRRVLAAVACCAIILVLGALTRRQCRIWRDTISLWSHVTMHDPGSFLGHLNLGVGYGMADQTDRAIAEWRRAIEIRPREALPYSNIGEALAEKGEIKSAIAYYERAISLAPRNPKLRAKLEALRKK